MRAERDASLSAASDFRPIFLRALPGPVRTGIVRSMTALHHRSPIQIGEFVLDPSLNELVRGGERQRLPAKLVDLLLRLATEPGVMVPRETLLEDVWERRLVNDEVLSRAIADLRQALGDDARTPRYIETVPKRGYRLLVAVGAATSGPVAAASAIVSPARAAARRWPRSSVGLVLLAVVLAIFVGWRGRARDEPQRPDPLTADNLLRARPFTTDPGRELFPRFTPDGRWVLYTRAGNDDAAATLRLRAVDGTEDRVLAEAGGDNFCGTVSPDGATLAWLRARPGACELVHRPLLGGPVRVLAGCRIDALASCPDWSPDGRRLVLGAVDVASNGLRAVAFPAGEETILTTPPAGQHDFLPRHAPHGAHVVFWRGDNGGRSLQRVDLASGRVEALRASPQLAFGHAFAPEGSLVLADDSLGQRALVRVDPTPEAMPSLLGGADARHPDVARDGGIVFEVARYDANLWRLDLAGDAVAREPRKLTRSARYDSQPAVSPDGAWIAFGSNRDGREAIYLMRSDGSEERKLPLDPALRWTSPVWSPDAERLLVQRYDTRGVGLCFYAIAAARVDCPSGLGDGLHAAFFLDAEHVGAIDADSTSSRLHRLRIAGGARSAIDGVDAVDRCRATSRWLACHRRSRPGLWLQDRRNGAAREILAFLPAEDRGAWVLAERAVYFATVGTPALPRGIHRYDPESGETSQVSGFWPSAIGDAVSVAPDESFLVVARTDALETDLVYVPPPESPVR